jgi:glycosyltransferase involved in cell wall biosynthesis
MPAKNRPTGIIWIGPVFDRGGYGNVSRNYLQGLAGKGLPVRAISVGPKHSEELGKSTLTWVESLEKVDAGKYPVVIINLTPESFEEVRTFGAVKKIGISIFETDRIPAHWVGLCNSVDEVWVPGQFNIDTYSKAGVDKSKLWAIPYAMNTELFNASRIKRKALEDRPLTFLYIFSFGWRKGFDLMLEAFMNEFKKGEAKLIMRAYTEGYQVVTRENLRDVLFGSVKDKVDYDRKDLPEVEIIDDSLTPEQLLKLYGRADVYISTDRANGWGMPCMEAMAMGIPAATIDWSGSTGFMNERNSLLIKPTGKLIPIDKRLSDALPKLYGGHKWAEVKPDEVRRVMRWAKDHPKELAEIGHRGEEDIQNNYNPDAIAGRILDHIAGYRPGVKARLGAALGVSRLVLVSSIRSRIRSRLSRIAKAALRR